MNPVNDNANIFSRSLNDLQRQLVLTSVLLNDTVAIVEKCIGLHPEMLFLAKNGYMIGDLLLQLEATLKTFSLLLIKQSEALSLALCNLNKVSKNDINQCL